MPKPKAKSRKVNILTSTSLLQNMAPTIWFAKVKKTAIAIGVWL